MDRSDPEFPVPASLVGYSKQGQSFQETLGNTTPKKKGLLWFIKFRVSQRSTDELGFRISLFRRRGVARIVNLCIYI